MPDTRYSASDTPEESEDDIRFDYELRDPLSFYGIAVIAALVLLLLIIVAGVMIYLL